MIPTRDTSVSQPEIRRTSFGGTVRIEHSTSQKRTHRVLMVLATIRTKNTCNRPGSSAETPAFPFGLSGRRPQQLTKATGVEKDATSWPR